MATLLRPPLIIDPNKEFLNSIIPTRPDAKPVPITTNSGKDAQLIISDTHKQISAIFINPEINSPGGLSVIRSARQHRPVLPIFLIYDEKLPFEEKDLKMLGIQKSIQKPVSYRQIVEFISPGRLEFDSAQAIAGGKNFSDVLDTEIASEDTDFVPIRSDDFLAGSICFFDVYIRLRAAKYIKIIQSGDPFSIDQMSSYLKKGVTHFYIRNEMQKHYLAYCDKLATTVVNQAGVSIDVKISQALNHGEEVLHFFEDHGIDPENIKFASQFIQNTQSIAKQMELEKQPILKDFLNDVTAYDHGIGVSMIAALLFRPLKITSADPVEIVGLSCLLHDIGLKKLKPPILIEDESKMTEEQKAVYQSHPIIGAEILKTVKGMKPVIIQAVSQHHERRNKKGFPDGIGAGSISIVAEIIGISDEYYRLITKQKEGTEFNLNFYLEHRIFNAFSNVLVAEFKKIFMSGEEIKGKPPGK